MNRLIDTGRKCGKETDINRSQVMRVSGRSESLRVKEIDHFKYFEHELRKDGY